jgi:DNA replication protein DnaC
MTRRQLPYPPDPCLPLNDADMARLKRVKPGLWTDWHKRCITCSKQGWFRTRDPRTGEIVEYDCNCCDQWLMHLWFSNAGIGLTFQRLGWANATSVPEAAKKVALDYALKAEANLRLGRGLIFYSQNKGTGKTLLSTLLAKQMLADGHDVHFIQFNELLDSYQNSWRDKDLQVWFAQRIRNAKFLVIDDIGREYKGRIGVVESMFDQVVRARSAESLPTIITSNITPENMREDYGDNIASLLTESYSLVKVDGPDYRPTVLANSERDAEEDLSYPVVCA